MRGEQDFGPSASWFGARTERVFAIVVLYCVYSTHRLIRLSSPSVFEDQFCGTGVNDKSPSVLAGRICHESCEAWSSVVAMMVQEICQKQGLFW